MEKSKKIFQIGCLFSGSASAVQYLFKNDPNYGHSYKIIAGASNKQNTKGEGFFREKRIPFKEFNAKRFCVEHGYEGPIRDMPREIRSQYFEQIRVFFTTFYNVNLIILSGFMLEITEPLLDSIPTANVHPADLRIIDPKTGKPKYIGDDAVTLAIEAGETSTRSTIHVVEKELDCGRIICVSDPLEVDYKNSTKAHQEKMKTLCDGPAYAKALSLITSGEFVF